MNIASASVIEVTNCDFTFNIERSIVAVIPERRSDGP